MRIVIFLLCFFSAQLFVYSQTEPVNHIKIIVDSISVNPAWDRLHKSVADRLGVKQADSIVLAVKVKYYLKHNEPQLYIDNYMEFTNRYEKLNTGPILNRVAWTMFEHATKPEDLKLAEQWAIQAVNEEPASPFHIDTYANILYKSGRLQEALEWQTRAVWYGRFQAAFLANMYKMKAGLPTWTYPPAVKAASANSNSEAVWNSIQTNITRKIDSVIWQTRLSVAKEGKDWNTYTSAMINYLEKFRVKPNALELNSGAWALFLYSDNKKHLEKALAWSNASLKDEANVSFMDTNANLLYKLGRKKEAIAMQEKAIKGSSGESRDELQVTLDKMKRGEETWK